MWSAEISTGDCLKDLVAARRFKTELYSTTRISGIRIAVATARSGQVPIWCHLLRQNLMGHTSPAVLWRHYHRAVTQKHAAAFWSIEPPKVSGKTIRFVAA